MFKISSNKKIPGFTLIEVMIALLVLGIGVFSVVQLYPMSLKIGNASKNLTLATNLAQAKVEEVISLQYDNIPLGTIEPRQRVSGDPADPFYNFERETIVIYVNGDLQESLEDLGLKKITTTMYWYNALNPIEKTFTIITLISRR